MLVRILAMGTRKVGLGQTKKEVESGKRAQRPGAVTKKECRLHMAGRSEVMSKRSMQ